MFRLYPDRVSPSWFARVIVFETRAAMYRAHPDMRKGGTLAFCTPLESRTRYYADGRSRTIPHVCDVTLTRENLSIEVISHEFLHATIAFGRRGYFNWSRLDAHDSVNDQEEWFCHVHSRMCAMFVERAERAKLYTVDDNGTTRVR